jgi:radical SAM superfamily enzyme YgiQ (UPF0313 family)
MNNKKIKILLLFSPFKTKASFGEPGVIAPLGIVSLATYLEKKLGKKVELKVVDGALLGYEASLNLVKVEKPDILGMSFYTPTALDAYDFINEVKRVNPKLTIMAGGPHVTALPDEALNKAKIDIVIIGEGEETCLKIVNNYLQFDAKEFREHLKDIDRIAFKSGKEIIKTPITPYQEAIDNLPQLDWKFLPLANYSGWYLKKNTKEAPIMFSRGCPFNCTFCSNAVWKVCKPLLRVRSPKHVADEIEDLVNRYGINEIYDCSDEFNNNIENAIAICEELIKRGLHKKIAWKTQLRAFPLPEKLVKVMAESGCWYVNLGIESGNPETLVGIRKFITLDQVESALKLLKKYNLKVQGLFMLYNVWEDKDGKLAFEDTLKTQNTLNFAKSLINKGLLDFIGWSLTTPYPGSSLYDIALRHKLIKPELIGQWSMWLKSERYVMNLPRVTSKDMLKMRNKGSWLRFLCIIKSGNYTFKDLVLLFKKGLGVLKANIQAKTGFLKKNSK